MPGGAPGSQYAGHMFGNGFAMWGATLAVSLSAYQCSYDASVYQGLRFSARGSGMVMVSIATASTVPIAEGGRCLSVCYDNFRAPFTLSDNWVQYSVPWSFFAQGGWGTPAFFSPRELMYLELAFGTNVAFDLYIDDVGFF